MDVISLNDGLTELHVVPALGGAIASWTRLSDQHAFFRQLPTELSELTARQLGAFALIPWSNRIAGGGVDTPEGWFTLPANTNDSPFAMHGATWQQAWQVVQQNAQSVELTITLQHPVAIQVRQIITLDKGCLQLAFTVTHIDEKPFWHGFGWHPFFIRTPQTQFKAALKGVWLNDEQQLSKACITIPEDWNFTHLRLLPDQKIDNAFTGWSGQCVIQQPDLGYQLTMTCQDAHYLIVYCPEQLPFFCVEPVSHPINAHHLAGKPGLVLLHKNQQLNWSVSVQYQSMP